MREARPERGLSFDLPCDPARLIEARERIRLFLRDACDDDEWIDDVVLAVEEACTNAIRHSGSADDIDVSLSIEGDELVAMVRDAGRGLSEVEPDLIHVPGMLETGGRGLFLIHELVDDMRLSSERGLEVRMTKQLPAGSGEAREAPPRQEPAAEPASPAVSRQPFDAALVGLPLVAAAAALIALFAHLRSDAAFAPPLLLTLLNLVLLGGTSLLVAVLAARSYARRPSTVLVFFGAGNLWLAAGATAAALHLAGSDANSIVTVYNTAAWAAGLCHVASAACGFSIVLTRTSRRVWALPAAYAATGVLAVVLVVTVRAGVWPTYFIPGTGHTNISDAVLWTATTMFALAAILFGLDLGRETSSFRRWYSLGLALIAVGLVGVSLQERLGDPLNWTGRLAQYAGAVMMVLAVAVSARQSGSWLLPMERALRESRDRYQTLFDLSPEAILVHADGTYVIANGAAAELFGASSPDELVGRRVLDFVPPEDAQLVAGRIEAAMSSGGSMPLRQLRVVRLDGRTVDVETRGARIELEGRPALQVVIRDVSEWRRAEAERERLLVQQERLYDELAEKERLSSALNGIAASITMLLDPQEILTRVVAQVGQAIGAESACICALDEASWTPTHGWQIPESVLGIPIPRARLPYAEGGLSSRAIVSVDDCHSDERVDLELQRSWGVQSVMMAPLVLRDQVVAGLFINFHGAPHAFTSAEVDFTGKAAAIVSSVLESARLYQDEHLVADRLQAALLAMPPHVDGAVFACQYHAATESAMVGGDFYDVFELEYGLLGVTVGDISGKGLDAAIMTSLVKNTLRAHGVEKGKTPAEAMRIANQLLLSSSAADVFATVFFGLLDLRDGRLVYTNAGHPPPALLRRDGVGELFPNSPLVGSFGDVEFTNSETWLERDDILLLYTDGLTEARRGLTQFGQGRLFELVLELRHSAPAVLVEEIRRRVVTFTGGRLQDDVAILAVQRTEAPPALQQKLLFHREHDLSEVKPSV